MVDRLNAVRGLACHRPDGAFYAFPACAGVLGSTTPDGRRIASADDFVLYLLESQDLAVLAGSAYGVSGFFRISFATSTDRLEEGCRRIAQACRSLAH